MLLHYFIATSTGSTSRKRRLRGIPDPDPVIPAEETDAKNPWGSLAEAWGASETEANWHQELEGQSLLSNSSPSIFLVYSSHFTGSDLGSSDFSFLLKPTNCRQYSEYQLKRTALVHGSLDSRVELILWPSLYCYFV